MTEQLSIAAMHDRLAFPVLGQEYVALHQVRPALFPAPPNDAGFLYANENATDPLAELLFSRMGDIEQFRSGDGRFYFRLAYSNGAAAVWSQTSVPYVNAGVTGFNLISGGGAGFGGLAARSGTGGAWMDGNPNNNNWWWAAGTNVNFGSNAIPANEPNSATSVTLFVTKEN